MQVQDQSEVVSFLRSLPAGADGSRAGETAPEPVTTHISVIVMRGGRVFKLKRAVHFPYLDFSTPESRLAFCRREYELNLRTAPALYTGVRRITRSSGDSLEFDGAGELVDAVVEMRRFDQRDLFDVMACEGRLTQDMLTRLAQAIAAFHADAPAARGISGAAAIESALATNEAAFGEISAFPAHEVDELLSLCRTRLANLRNVLDLRSAEGRIKRCHGDLHLRNICLFEGAPVLFDCLEFDEDLATIDVLYDLAFLLMDLWHRNLRFEANLVFNRYLDETGDTKSLSVMPFFMAMRAAVRAHVGASSAEGAADGGAKLCEAHEYLHLARALLREPPVQAVAAGGLSGSGKSSVAAGLAPHLGAAPGARILSTDRLRKKLAGLPVEARLPPESYTQAASVRVYEEQRAQASNVLAGGWSVIADGVFLKEDERRAFEAVAAHAKTKFTGLWLQAPAEELTRRIRARTGDPSDATVSVMRMQEQQKTGAVRWRRIDASGTVEESISAALQALAIPPPAIDSPSA